MDKPFTEVSKINISLKPNQACGFDSISNAMVKASGSHLVTILTAFSNTLLSRQYFPSMWSSGIFIPTFKWSKSGNANNLRGIANYSCLSKLFTTLLSSWLTHYSDTNGLIKYTQIRFHKGFRTSDHIFTLNTITDSCLQRGQKPFICIVDFWKANESVWKDELFYKLAN